MQPRSSQPFDTATAQAIVARFVRVPGGLIPALQAIQAAFGHVPRGALKLLAQGFNITEAEAYGVASFYHDFRLDRPAGRRTIKLCRAEACQAVGAGPVAARVKDKLGIDWGGTTADGEWSLEPVFCLGLCACGPSAMIDGEVHGRLDADTVETLL
ncbi:MAG: NAD(P)H-dependent oxidoreductase subunit E [Alphaproteobacteria bacterium]|nr:NAD(P)H-dependent oxidoreductase subunit E [Alphaproteobacteria bacterium]